MEILIDDSIISHTGLSERDIEIELAVAFYKSGKFSLGLACKLAKMDKVEFYKELAKRNAYLNYDSQDLEDDIATLDQLFPKRTN